MPGTDRVRAALPGLYTEGSTGCGCRRGFGKRMRKASREGSKWFDPPHPQFFLSSLSLDCGIEDKQPRLWCTLCRKDGCFGFDVEAEGLP
eukprot:3941156-Rhodomonas_salina.2